MSRVRRRVACAAMNRSSVTRVSFAESARPAFLNSGIGQLTSRFGRSRGLIADDCIVEAGKHACVEFLDVRIERLGEIDQRLGPITWRGKGLQYIVRHERRSLRQPGASEAPADDEVLVAVRAP